MQLRIFKDFSSVDWAKLHKEENQKQINKMKAKQAKKQETLKARIRYELSFKSEKDKRKFVRHLMVIKKQLKIK